MGVVACASPNSLEALLPLLLLLLLPAEGAAGEADADDGGEPAPKPLPPPPPALLPPLGVLPIPPVAAAAAAVGEYPAALMGDGAASPRAIRADIAALPADWMAFTPLSAASSVCCADSAVLSSVGAGEGACSLPLVSEGVCRHCRSCCCCCRRCEAEASSSVPFPAGKGEGAPMGVCPPSTSASPIAASSCSPTCFCCRWMNRAFGFQYFM